MTTIPDTRQEKANFNDFVSVQQAAQEANVSDSTIYRRIADGRIGHLRVGNSKLIRKEDLPKLKGKQWSGHSF